MQTAQGDIRLVLGQLQMIRIRARSLSYDQASPPQHCRPALLSSNVACPCELALHAASSALKDMCPCVLSF